VTVVDEIHKGGVSIGGGLYAASIFRVGWEHFGFEEKVTDVGLPMIRVRLAIEWEIDAKFET
jgi:hypothetical protein